MLDVALVYYIAYIVTANLYGKINVNFQLNTITRK